MEIRQTEVDGVPTWWAPVPGPLTAALVFRVGRADEPLARAGICHLVEHLAMYSLGEVPHAHNGFVDDVTTVFVTSGDAEEVSRFLRGVAGSLHALPLERLPVERDVLRAEAAQRSEGLESPLSIWRYGAATWGLLGHGDLGIPAVDEEELRAWTAERYTRGNAALWLTGEPPSGVRLPLPEGRRIPLPRPSSALRHTPAWFPLESSSTSFSAVVPRSTAATAYTVMLEQRLQSVLRHERGISYSPAVVYDRRDADHAHVTGAADALGENAHAVLQAVVHEVERFPDAEVDAQALERWRRGARESDEEPAAQRGMLHAAVWDALTGASPVSPAEVQAEREAVTADDVRAVAREAADSALYGAPGGCAPEGSRLVVAPLGSRASVEGRAFRSRARATATHRLRVADDGVSLWHGDQGLTVRYDACAAVLAWPDGRRVLIGEDGFVVTVEPTLWRRGHRAVAALDAAAPPERVVPMPLRAAEEIPGVPFWERHDVLLARTAAVGTGLAALGAVTLIWVASDVHAPTLLGMLVVAGIVWLPWGRGR